MIRPLLISALLVFAACTNQAQDHIARARNNVFEKKPQAANLLVTGKRAFARALRAVVAEYVGDEALVDAEFAELVSAI